MFGFRNFTGRAFIIKATNFTIEFSLGVIEEVTFNLTTVAAANAVEPSVNLQFISKDRLLATTSLAVSSKIVRIKVYNLIFAATPNLLI